MRHPALVATADRYLHAVPLAGADAEDVGPFTLFRPRSPVPYYARPTPGHTGGVTAADISRLGRRCTELGLPRSLEWVVETAPSVGPACAEAGWDVVAHPLLALDPARLVAVPTPSGITVRVLPADPASLRRAWAVVEVAFAQPPGPTSGPCTAPGEADDGRVAPELVTALTERAARGVTVTVAAQDAGGVTRAVGQHQPVDRTTEVVAVATLPGSRRRGLAGAVITTLVQDARARGVGLVLLSAGTDDSARLYERLGFRRIGSVGAAEAPQLP